MNDFDALLTRAFAEAEQPADDGFSVRVSETVARRDKALRWRTGLQNVGMGAAIAVVGYVALGAAFSFGQEWLASASLDVTRAVGSADDALANGSGLIQQAESAGSSWLQSTSLGLTQILLIAGALMGGAVAYRSAQD